MKMLPWTPANQQTLLDSLYVLRFGSLFVLDNVKLNSLAFRQRLEPITRNSGKVHENVRSALLLNKTKPFFLVEPFYCATCHVLLTSSGIILIGKSPIVGKQKTGPARRANTVIYTFDY